jgi:hypothetical protein
MPGPAAGKDGYRRFGAPENRLRPTGRRDFGAHVRLARQKSIPCRNESMKFDGGYWLFCMQSYYHPESYPKFRINESTTGRSRRIHGIRKKILARKANSRMAVFFSNAAAG